MVRASGEQPIEVVVQRWCGEQVDRPDHADDHDRGLGLVHDHRKRFGTAD
jgi:hypothetical protein